MNRDPKSICLWFWEEASAYGYSGGLTSALAESIVLGNDNPISEEGRSGFVLESKFCICHCETVKGYYALNILCQLNFDMHFTADQTSVTIILPVSEGRYRKNLTSDWTSFGASVPHHTDWLKHTLLSINQMTNQIWRVDLWRGGKVQFHRFSFIITNSPQ